MQSVYIILFLSLFSFLLQAQNQEVKSIESKIALYEAKIQEKERAIARNTANGNESENARLREEIISYEGKIVSLLDNLQLVQQDNRTELAFVNLQERVKDLEKENESLREEITRLRQASLQKGNTLANIPSSTVSTNTFIDPRDGELYTTVQIGQQLWMAENLRYNEAGSMLNPNNPSRKYGRLYTKEQAKFACPPGWRLPDEDDWIMLEAHLGMSQRALMDIGRRGNVAHKLKATNDWEDNGFGDNSSGFNALPAGMRKGDSFQYLGRSAVFWVWENSYSSSFNRYLNAADNQITRSNFYSAQDYFSCRCLKDQ